MAEGWVVVSVRCGGTESCEGATSYEQREDRCSSLFPFGRLYARETQWPAFV